jgi:outer membrane protein OmpA-like peptidoglycan-associated protein
MLTNSNHFNVKKSRCYYLLFFYLCILFSYGQNAIAALQVYVSAACPICNDYLDDLEALSSKYPKLAIRVFVLSGSKEENGRFRNDWSDTKFYNTVKQYKKLNVNTVPTFQLLDSSYNEIYIGKFDDKYFKLGKTKLEPTELYILDALTNYLSGNEIKIKKTAAVGCILY